MDPVNQSSDCDRCGGEIRPLDVATNIQFSGGVDAQRLACGDCIEDIVDVWNEGDAAGGESA